MNGLDHKFNCKCSNCRLSVRPTKFDPVKFYRIEAKIRLYNEVAQKFGSTYEGLNKVLSIKV